MSAKSMEWLQPLHPGVRKRLADHVKLMIRDTCATVLTTDERNEWIQVITPRIEDGSALSQDVNRRLPEGTDTNDPAAREAAMVACPMRLLTLGDVPSTLQELLNLPTDRIVMRQRQDVQWEVSADETWPRGSNPSGPGKENNALVMSMKFRFRGR